MKNILLGRDNPNGYPLEQVLSQLIKEVTTKCSFIALDETPEANTVLSNNLNIISCLQTARDTQQDSMSLLESISDSHDVNDKNTYRIGIERNYKGKVYK